MNKLRLGRVESEPIQGLGDSRRRRNGVNQVIRMKIAIDQTGDPTFGYHLGESLIQQGNFLLDPGRLAVADIEIYMLFRLINGAHYLFAESHLVQ